jgi:hypothetical protein
LMFVDKVSKDLFGACTSFTLANNKPSCPGIVHNATWVVTSLPARTSFQRYFIPFHNSRTTLRKTHRTWALYWKGGEKKHAGDKVWRKWVDAGISASTSYIYRGAQVQHAKASQKIKPYIYWHRNTSPSLTIPSHQSYYLVPLTLATINSTPYRYQWLIVVPDISATPHSWHPSSSGHNILLRRT